MSACENAVLTLSHQFNRFWATENIEFNIDKCTRWSRAHAKCSLRSCGSRKLRDRRARLITSRKSGNKSRRAVVIPRSHEQNADRMSCTARRCSLCIRAEIVKMPRGATSEAQMKTRIRFARMLPRRRHRIGSKFFAKAGEVKAERRNVCKEILRCS